MLQTSCVLDYSEFPYDTQTCELVIVTLTSYFYPVKLTYTKMDTSHTNFLNFELGWELVKVKSYIFLTELAFKGNECCLDLIWPEISGS